MEVISCIDSYDRRIAHGMKESHIDSLRHAAFQMKTYVDSSVILIPVPGRTGHSGSNLILANMIASFTGCDVADIIHGKERESLYELKKKRIIIDNYDDFFGFSLKRHVNGNLILIDNVIDTGITAKQIAKILKINKILVYTKKQKL